MICIKDIASNDLIWHCLELVLHLLKKILDLQYINSVSVIHERVNLDNFIILASKSCTKKSQMIYSNSKQKLWISLMHVLFCCKFFFHYVQTESKIRMLNRIPIKSIYFKCFKSLKMHLEWTGKRDFGPFLHFNYHNICSLFMLMGLLSLLYSQIM